MSRQPIQLPLPGFETARARWRHDYEAQAGNAPEVRNRSGIPVEPLYTPDDWSAERYMEVLGFPGEPPMTRGIYPSMHRGRRWTQRQLVGFGTPEDTNRRLKAVLAAGGSGTSLAPCNSFFRGYDCDEVDPLLLGTCGAVVNTVEDMDACFRDIDIGGMSTALNDPVPFTQLAMLLAVARRRGVPWSRITGTSNQSDYISHFAANHMFFRIALAGSRRILLDQIEFCRTHVPGWNPVSIVGQHMQQGGATPAEAMGLTLSTALQYAEDCRERGIDLDAVLPRFTFFFDISISFFEEIAKFRAMRRLYARTMRDRFGAQNPECWRMRFSVQSAGNTLTTQQPQVNIVRAGLEALAAALGGAQSIHLCSYDEGHGLPTPESSRMALRTQQVIAYETGVTRTVDPLGGSYYVEALTNQLETAIAGLIDDIDARGGMAEAIASGWLDEQINVARIRNQQALDSGEKTLVGVNKFTIPPDEEAPITVHKAKVDEWSGRRADYLRDYRARRDAARWAEAMAHIEDAWRRGENMVPVLINAVQNGVTMGECHQAMRQAQDWSFR